MQIYVRICLEQPSWYMRPFFRKGLTYPKNSRYLEVMGIPQCLFGLPTSQRLMTPALDLKSPDQSLGPGKKATHEGPTKMGHRIGALPPTPNTLFSSKYPLRFFLGYPVDPLLKQEAFQVAQRIPTRKKQVFQVGGLRLDPPKLVVFPSVSDENRRVGGGYLKLSRGEHLRAQAGEPDTG